MMDEVYNVAFLLIVRIRILYTPDCLEVRKVDRQLLIPESEDDFAENPRN